MADLMDRSSHFDTGKTYLTPLSGKARYYLTLANIERKKERERDSVALISIMDNTTDGILIYLLKGEILYQEKFAKRLFGDTLIRFMSPHQVTLLVAVLIY